MLYRPYHPNYTHTNFRGWYEFGGGSIADMGHYSLWPIFQLLELDSPISVESTPSHVCTVSDAICRRIKDDYSFPAACTIRMRFAAKGERPALDLFWYDGGIKPPVPEELMSENKELQEEGMMFVGDKGKIVGGFRGENSQLIPEAKMCAFRTANNLPEPAPRQRGAGGKGATHPRNASWINAFKGGPASYGDFQLAGPICDTVTLASISLRLGGRRLLWIPPARRSPTSPRPTSSSSRISPGLGNEPGEMLMTVTSRREFLQRMAACSGVAGFLAANTAELRADPLGRRSKPVYRRGRC